MILFLLAIFGRRWRWVTLAVILIVAGLTRLGLWQLDRRIQKIELNQRMAARWQSAPFDLNQEALPTDLADLQFRRIQVTGTFDYAQQIAIKGVNRNQLPGVALVTPLVMADGRAVLVVRGWVSSDKAKPEQWGEFDEAQAQATVVGLMREDQPLPGAPQPTAPQKEWFRVDLTALQAQMPYPLLPAFVEMLAEPNRSAMVLPIRADEPAPYDEFMHLSYAAQWFIFALIGAFGYLMFVRQQEMRRARLATPDAITEQPASVMPPEGNSLATDR